jgi:hypothetical protein
MVQQTLEVVVVVQQQTIILLIKLVELVVVE